ncbi:MAG TPA: SAF domain-containing protein [Propionibacteriaceae bacterium]|nr:SAF domain-containing protein [Propionibacteriaceae bacterium]HPZ49931.1 SAF domain-containing protein [Propionibacteriaceae bacterium]HQE31729.1 SAF domain-containing protein [Propionibacteriaceae bacterium]
MATAVAVLTGLSAVTSTQTPTTLAVTTAREIPAGSTLTEADLVVRPVRTVDLPDRAATSAPALVGKVTGSALARNTVMTDLSVVSGRSASAAGRVVMSVRVADAEVASMVAPGMRVTLLVPGSNGGLITDDALVVTTPQAAPSAPLGGGGGSAVLVVDVESAIAERLVRSTSTTGVTVALH